MGDFDYTREYENWIWNIPEYFNMGYDAVDKHVLDPREIEFVKELPKTQSGKIKRKLLREQEIEKKRG